LHIWKVASLHRHEFGPTTGLLDASDDFPAKGISAAGDRYRGALCGKQFGDCSPDAARTTRDERDLVPQSHAITS
jgi:hypothetical protein